MPITLEGHSYTVLVVQSQHQETVLFALNSKTNIQAVRAAVAAYGRALRVDTDSGQSAAAPSPLTTRRGDRTRLASLNRLLKVVSKM